VRDDTQALQSWIDAERRPGNRVPDCLQPHTYVIRDTLRVGRSMGLRLAGAGGPNRSPNPGWDSVRVGTILEWQGPADKPMIEVSGATCLVLHGLNLVGLANHGILFRHGSGGTLNIAIRDCSFMGMKVGVQCGTEHGEQTCANITSDNCHFEGISEACYRTVNSQSLEHLFLRPKFANSPIAIDVQAGGDVTAIGGGTYEVKTLLRLGDVASNTRGFDFSSLRIDGDGTRTQWLQFVDKKTPKTYGQIRFVSMSQNAGQLTSEHPLMEVAPGSRVICEACSFHAEPKLRGGMLAHIHSTDKAAGELIVNYCDGIGGQFLKDYVKLTGSRSRFAFQKCGTLYGPTRSLSNFEEDTNE
jgi:hypothetical protein